MKIRRDWGGDDSKETVSFRQNRTDLHINSEGLWQRIQDRHKFKPDGVPEVRGDVDMGVPPLLKKLFAIDTLRQKDTQFSTMKLSLSLSTTCQYRLNSLE